MMGNGLILCVLAEKVMSSTKIIGTVADDDLFKTVDMYARGIWDKERIIKELMYYKTKNQICTVNQSVLVAALHFQESYKVSEHNG